MACYQPIHGFRAPGGQIKFTRSGAYRDRPQTISCGQCIGCRLERSRQWACRCVHEASQHDRNCFLTLTYNKNKVPRDGSLDVTHWQDFAKRVRWKYGPFRYFHCGEYGTINNRPHYHAAIFGLDFWEGRELLSGSGGDHQLYGNSGLEETWGNGYLTIGELNFQTAAYVARYILKKITGDSAEKHYNGRKPEYVTMSRNPGIGANWIAKYLDEVYPDDFVVMNEKKSRPPKFYDKKLEEINPLLWKQVRLARLASGAKNEDNNTPDRHEVREEVTRLKMQHFERAL